MNSQAEISSLKVIKVTPLDNYRLCLLWSDGQQLILNIASLINRRDVYWRLRNPRYFNQVGVDPLGGICWPEGEDLAPDGLERYLNVE